MAKINAPQVHMDMPIEEALDFVESVRDLKEKLLTQPRPLNDARAIATRLKVIETFSDAMAAAMKKAV